MNKRVRPKYHGAEIITALIYLCAMSASLMYVVCRTRFIPCTIIMTAVSFGIYCLFYKMRNKRIYAVLSFLAVVLVTSAVVGITLSQGSLKSFVEFIFNNSESFDAGFAGTVILLFSSIIGFATCYFSVYLPRPSFLMFPALIPMILSARTAGGLPAEFVVFLAAGFALAALGTAQPVFPDDVTYFEDKNSRKERLAVVGIFGVILALLLAVIPRNSETPMGDYLDTVINRRASFYGTNALTNFTQSSGVNHGANELSDDLLFYASTNFPVNVSRWAFDKYNGESGWTSLSDYGTGWSSWKTQKQSLSANALASKLRQGAAEGLLEEYSSMLLGLSAVPEQRYYTSARMTIRVADNSSTKVIIHPNRTINVTINDYDKSIYRTLKDEMFADTNLGKNAVYTLEYYISNPNESLINLFEEVDMGELLTAAEEQGVITNTEKTAFLSEREQAEEYYSKTLADPIDPEIVKLAKEITSGLTSNYEKALAIERWFGEAGFIYDLGYVPEETTAEYFLFESKRGICSDYATAATLLLRAAGIPTRYVEGFVLDEDSRDEYERYAVKAANAHAYAMSYIEGLGWLEIDGTKYVEVYDGGDALSVPALIILIIIAAAAIAALLFRNQISEAIFAISLVFRSKNGKIRSIYLRTRKLVCSINGTEPKSASSGEIKDIASRSLGMGKETEEITDSADILLYGDKNTNISPKKLYKNYRLIRKTKRKMKK